MRSAAYHSVVSLTLFTMKLPARSVRRSTVKQPSSTMTAGLFAGSVMPGARADNVEGWQGVADARRGPEPARCKHHRLEQSDIKFLVSFHCTQPTPQH